MCTPIALSPVCIELSLKYCTTWKPLAQYRHLSFSHSTLYKIGIKPKLLYIRRCLSHSGGFRLAVGYSIPSRFFPLDRIVLTCRFPTHFLVACYLIMSDKTAMTEKDDQLLDKDMLTEHSASITSNNLILLQQFLFAVENRDRVISFLTTD